MSTLPALNPALRAHARGRYADEAGVELLISHGAFLRRSDFCERFVHLATSITDETTRMATIEWSATITALDTGDLPCSGGEQRILQIADLCRVRNRAAYAESRIMPRLLMCPL